MTRVVLGLTLKAALRNFKGCLTREAIKPVYIKQRTLLMTLPAVLTTPTPEAISEHLLTCRTLSCLHCCWCHHRRYRGLPRRECRVRSRRKCRERNEDVPAEMDQINYKKSLPKIRSRVKVYIRSVKTIIL